MVTMYMPLLNEGTDVWRPVEVTPLSGGVYRVEGPMPDDEEWAFAPGTIVDCRWETFDGQRRLVPKRSAFPTVKERLLKWSIILGAVIVSFIPFSTDLNWIVTPSPYTTPYLAGWAVAMGLIYYRWRIVQIVRETTGPLALVFSAAAILALFA